MKSAESMFLVGAALAIVSGAIILMIGGVTDESRVLLAEPMFVAAGLTAAAIAGGLLARKAVVSNRIEAFGLALGYGLLVPVITAGIVLLPVAPLAMALSTAAWPATVPAAMVWLVGVRLADREGLARDRPVRLGVAVVLAFVLLGIRFTQPAWTSSASGGRCLTFPGERVDAIAWSPDGEWLGIGSEVDHATGIVRVYGRQSERIFELARGPDVEAVSSGVAVGPGGEVAYLVDHFGVGDQDEDAEASIWVASPSEEARRIAPLPTPGVGELTFTRDGIAAMLWVNPETWTETHQLVWIRESSTSDGSLEPMRMSEWIRHPVLAPLVGPDQASPMAIATPNGAREVPWPRDLSDEPSVSPDGAYLVFHAYEVAEDDDAEVSSLLIAQSTTTQHRTVLAREAAWEPHLANGWIAYLTFPAYENNSICIKDVSNLLSS